MFAFFANTFGYLLNFIYELVKEDDKAIVENIEKEFSLLYNSLNPEMPRNCARWGFSYESWNAGTSFLKNYALNRIWQIKNEVKNYFYLSQEEMNEYFS